MDNNHFFRVVIFGFQNFYDMDFLDPKINSYAEAHTKAESKLLAELNRDTNACLETAAQKNCRWSGDY